MSNTTKQEVDEAANALSLARDKLENAAEDMNDGEPKSKLEELQERASSLYDDVEAFLEELG